jgi:hypothetical protein
MKGKILLLLSVLIFAGFGWFVLKTLFTSNEQLIIPAEGLAIEMAEKTFKVIDSEGEPIRISLGQVNRKRAVIDILLGASNLKKEDIKIGESVQFNYENSIYKLALTDIKAKIIGEETAYFLLTKKGQAQDVVAEKSISTIMKEIENSKIEVFRKNKKIPLRRFLRRLKNKSRRVVTFEELLLTAEDHFPNYQIKEDNKDYNTVSEWLKTKK